jgi:hypothetical protein
LPNREKTAISAETRTVKVAFTAFAATANFSAVTALIAKYVHQDAWLIASAVITTLGLAVIFTRLIKSNFIQRQNWWKIAIYFTASLLVASLLLAWVAATKVTPLHLTIETPTNGATVTGYRSTIRGTLKEHTNARVYVVVRPLLPLDYWVQDAVTADSTGNWQVNAYFGDANAGAGEDYEIIAVATDENFLVTLLTGNLLTPGKTATLPRNSNRSNIVTVRRAA